MRASTYVQGEEAEELRWHVCVMLQALLEAATEEEAVAAAFPDAAAAELTSVAEDDSGGTWERWELQVVRARWYQRSEYCDWLRRALTCTDASWWIENTERGLAPSTWRKKPDMPLGIAVPVTPGDEANRGTEHKDADNGALRDQLAASAPPAPEWWLLAFGRWQGRTVQELSVAARLRATALWCYAFADAVLAGRDEQLPRELLDLVVAGSE